MLNKLHCSIGIGLLNITRNLVFRLRTYTEIHIFMDKTEKLERKARRLFQLPYISIKRLTTQNSIQRLTYSSVHNYKINLVFTFVVISK